MKGHGILRQVQLPLAWHSRHVVQLSATSQDRMDIQKGLLFSASSHVYAGAEAARLPGT